MRTDVACSLTVSSPAPATALLQVVVAAPAEEQLTVLTDGRPVPAEEIAVPGARVHRLQLLAGETTISYSAQVSSGGAPRPVTPADWAEFVRPSRYCPSDQLEGYAGTEFDRSLPRAELVAAVAAWVHRRLVYTSGSSRPVDTAVDTLLLGQGVCRDYAHLTITLLRALEVPARLVAVYAPGLSPMDFHAVVEADVDGVWHTVDATRLAPTSALVRICSGRDAADTAFLSLFGGRAAFRGMTVTATVDGDLPAPADEPFPLP
ncbi:MULTISPECIES: transglutaminase-like domain-containing protein [unclassified Modestobacter]|uniref:transglutaminase-like domain-containing protein n=1 Tax=unclassified Modestobacter TaxID=2643866 RepID=UPI0022AB33FB|nr:MULTISPECIES: transglutaminase family protein [unclassified Modestobacter]MCZ2824468.1 transglutaminase family protein [Modestobacter sp. VKM Ac-2981]MCZ2854004.1 transglutaminase family protein [Modestobacter sp. VKM Ac-2982]